MRADTVFFLKLDVHALIFFNLKETNQVLPWLCGLWTQNGHYRSRHQPSSQSSRVHPYTKNPAGLSTKNPEGAYHSNHCRTKDFADTSLGVALPENPHMVGVDAAELAAGGSVVDSARGFAHGIVRSSDGTAAHVEIAGFAAGGKFEIQLVGGHAKHSRHRPRRQHVARVVVVCPRHRP